MAFPNARRLSPQRPSAHQQDVDTDDDVAMDPLTESDRERAATLDDIISSLADKSSVQLLAAVPDAREDIFQEEQAAKESMVDKLVDELAGARNEPVTLEAAQPTELNQLRSFLASDAETADKMERLVSFLADEQEAPRQHPSELLAEAGDTETFDVFAAEQTAREQQVEALVSGLTGEGDANDAILLAADAGQASLPPMALGGAFLLLVAVLLTAVAKRSSGAKHKKQKQDDLDFGYLVLHE